MYLWDELLDFWDEYRSQVLLAVGLLVLVPVGLFAYHKATCCSRRPPLECMLMDVAGTTRQAKESYSGLAKSIVVAQSERDGSVCFADLSGDPEAESEVQTMYVGAENLSNSSNAALERSENQIKAMRAINELLQHPPLRIAGSAIVEALAAVAPKMRPGETIQVFSDGIQDSADFKLRNLHRNHYSEQSIEQALDRLGREGYLPSLTGVNVVFPKLGFQGEGGHSIVTGPALERFWSAWRVKTGANLIL